MESKMKRLYQMSVAGWGSGERETRCGHGSIIKENLDLVKYIDKLVMENSIKTIADLGCGDFNWMKMVDLCDIDYTGIDWYFHGDRNSRYETDRIRFIEGNIVTMKLPKVDLVICKDVMIHMPNSIAVTLLQNIIRSNSHMMLATTYACVNNDGRNVVTYSEINLEQDPFNLDLIDRGVSHGDSKYTSLYKLSYE